MNFLSGNSQKNQDQSYLSGDYRDIRQTISPPAGGYVDETIQDLTSLNGLEQQLKNLRSY